MGRASRRRSQRQQARPAIQHDRRVPPNPEARQLRACSSYPTGDVSRGLERLGEWRAEREGLERAIALEVADLVVMGASWGDVGRALGMTRQGARQRYGTRPIS